MAQIVAAGLEFLDADRATGTALIYANGSALGTVAEVSLNRRLSRAGQDLERTIEQFLSAASETAAQLSHLRVRLGTRAATSYAAVPGNTFAFGLEAIREAIPDSFEGWLSL